MTHPNRRATDALRNKDDALTELGIAIIVCAIFAALAFAA